jgi:hypothetical protein
VQLQPHTSINPLASNSEAKRMRNISRTFMFVVDISLSDASAREWNNGLSPVEEIDQRPAPLGRPAFAILHLGSDLPLMNPSCARKANRANASFRKLLRFSQLLIAWRRT